MPLLRVELPITDRAHGRKVVARYAEGGRDREAEESALAEVRRRGRVPAGRPVCVGLTNGSAPLLRFDVPVDPDV